MILTHSSRLAARVSASNTNGESRSKIGLIKSREVSRLQRRILEVHMRRNVLIVATVACLTTAALSAQTSSTAAAGKDTITVTGCVQPDTMSAANSPTSPAFK